ncbi:MAG TPA: PAN domain-containing protein [Haliangiales bacterium]|nr:PAN domain-containing protein [Haliangiales bacterium]
MSRVGVAFAVISLALVSGAHAQQSVLWGNDHLFAGQTVVAPSCYYRLVMQADGNLVLYAGRDATWASDTWGRGGYAVMQADGNFVVYTWGDEAIWSTGTWGNPYSRVYMQDDGNLVLYHGADALWASDTYGEPVGTTTCPWSSVTGVETNVNRYGGDYTGFDISQPRPLWCAYYCAEDSRCLAFTYVPPGIQGPYAKCWLKSTVPGQSYAPGLVSGVIYH